MTYVAEAVNYRVNTEKIGRMHSDREKIGRMAVKWGQYGEGHLRELISELRCRSKAVGSPGWGQS